MNQSSIYQLFKRSTKKIILMFVLSFVLFVLASPSDPLMQQKSLKTIVFRSIFSIFSLPAYLGYKIISHDTLRNNDWIPVLLNVLLILYWHLSFDLMAWIYNRFKKKSKLLAISIILILILIIAGGLAQEEWRKEQSIRKCREENFFAPNCEAYCNNPCGYDNPGGLIFLEESICLCNF